MTLTVSETLVSVPFVLHVLNQVVSELLMCMAVDYKAYSIGLFSRVYNLYSDRHINKLVCTSFPIIFAHLSLRVSASC